MAVIIPDEKCLILLIKKYCWLVQYAAGYHPGPVAPPKTDGASLAAFLCSFKWEEMALEGGTFKRAKRAGSGFNSHFGAWS